MKEEDVKLVGKELSKAIGIWAGVLNTSREDEWAHFLEFDAEDVANVSLLFVHVLTNVGFKRGVLYDEGIAREIGKQIHELVWDMTNIDLNDYEQE